MFQLVCANDGNCANNVCTVMSEFTDRTVVWSFKKQGMSFFCFKTLQKEKKSTSKINKLCNSQHLTHSRSQSPYKGQKGPTWSDPCSLLQTHLLPFSLSHSAPATLGPWLVLQLTQHIPHLRDFTMLLPLPKAFLFQTTEWFLSSLHSHLFSLGTPKRNLV